MKKNISLNIPKSEKKILLFNRHWILMFYGVFSSLFLIFIAILLIQIQEAIPLSNQEITTAILTLTSLALYIFTKWYLLWKSEIYLITDSRIFHAKVQFFHRIKKEQVVLKLVNTIDSVKPSIFAQIFKYGNIKIGTNYKQKDADFTMTFIPHPNKTLKIINKNIS